MKNRFIAFVFFLTNLAFSLEIGESYNAKLEKILPENVIVLSKGKSDHVQGFDQIKIFSGNTFVARALSLGAGRYRSSWKLFRVVSPSSFKLGADFSIKSVNQQDLPWEYIEKPISHYRQIVIDFYPSKSANYTRVNEGDFAKVESKVLFKGEE